MLKLATSWIRNNCLFALEEDSIEGMFQFAQVTETLPAPPTQSPTPTTTQPVKPQTPQPAKVVTLPRPSRGPVPQPGEVWLARKKSDWQANIMSKTPVGWNGLDEFNDYIRPCLIKSVNGDSVQVQPLSTAFRMMNKAQDIPLLESDPLFAQTGISKSCYIRGVVTTLHRNDLTRKVGSIPAAMMGKR